MNVTYNSPVYGQIEYSESFWANRKSIKINDVPAKKLSKNTYDINGKEGTIKGNYLTGVTLTIDNNKIRLLASPTWYEFLICALPILIAIIWGNSAFLCEALFPVLGGMLGGALGAAFSFFALVLMRKIQTSGLKVLAGVGMVAVNILVSFALALAFVTGLNSCINYLEQTRPTSLQYEKIAGKEEYRVVGLLDAESDIELKIPAAYEGIPVTQIKKDAFYNTEITTVTIPDSIKVIGKNAFYGCSELKTVHFGKNVEKIEDGAFYACKKLESFNLPASITSLGNNVFDGSNVTKVTIEEGVTTILAGTFQNFGKLKSITLPSSVKVIENSAFSNCQSLESINIPDGVTYIGNYALLNADITSISLPNSLNTLGIGALAGTGLTEIVIPDDVKRIEDQLLAGCYQLTSVSFADDVNYIGEKAFVECKRLKSITIPTTVTTISNHAFSGCEALDGIIDLRQVYEINEYAFQNCESLDGLIVSSNLYVVGLNATYSTTLKVYFDGTMQEWTETKTFFESALVPNERVYFYSESTPTDDGNYWYFDNGVPTIWDVNA